MAIRINIFEELEREGYAITVEDDPAYIKEKEERHKRMQELRRKQMVIATLSRLESEKIILCM
ncbi:hypothetical protein [Chitinophaga qingshengii]|uniref:TubC N-terminal docking domain-containing protein n=1 Tax=Chitinophaga qingshengii TaxID=1569794 RepID=A0ABR7TU03_9BACT|nr:hypothetical protein [Chitinophaga qingshengii]MBC9932879.1 hypothetical protein [Chitinophaga qingshengii]